MEILLTLTYSALFIFLIGKMKFFTVAGVSKRTFCLIFLLKLAAGFSLWAIYTFYYTDRATADIYKYFDDSKVIHEALKTNPLDYFKMLSGLGNNTPAFDHYYAEMHYWARKVDSSIYNDSHTIIRFNAFIRLFSCGYYNVHTVFICFLSLVGLTGIYKTFVPHIADKKKELLFSVFLIPSVLFWGSGVLKEGLIFFALGMLIYFATKLFSLRSVLICLATAALLALSKFYVWLAILPGILLLVWTNKTTAKNVFLKFTVILVFMAVVGLNIDSCTSIQNPLVTLSQKQIEFDQLANGLLTDSDNKPIPAANSLIEINKLEPTLRSFIINSPRALVNTFLRPALWESGSLLMTVSAVETLFILILFFNSFFFLKPLSEIKWVYVLFCFSFVLFQFLVIGETTPVLGAIARYKTIALPFLLIALLFIIDKEKVIKKFPVMKKMLD